MLRKISIGILAVVAIFSAILAAGVPDVQNWWEISKPFYWIFFTSASGILILVEIKQVRRVIYPLFACICSWIYKYNLVKNRFTYNCYRLYTRFNYSYIDLYDYVQSKLERFGYSK